MDAYAARDVDEAVSILTDDTITMSHGAPNTIGKPATTASIKEQMTDPALRILVPDESVDVAGWPRSNSDTFSSC